MLTLKTGNVFHTRLQTICCTTNTIGAMGRGVALYTKKKYPNVFQEYRRLFKAGELGIHKLHTVPTPDGHQVLLFPTKEEWWNPTQPDWVAINLKLLANTYESLGITSLAMVPPGGTNGWMDKDLSIWLVETYLNDLSIPVELYL